jgi:hypothetical protein
MVLDNADAVIDALHAGAQRTLNFVDNACNNGDAGDASVLSSTLRGLVLRRRVRGLAGGGGAATTSAPGQGTAIPMNDFPWLEYYAHEADKIGQFAFGGSCRLNHLRTWSKCPQSIRLPGSRHPQPH